LMPSNLAECWESGKVESFSYLPITISVSLQGSNALLIVLSTVKNIYFFRNPKVVSRNLSVKSHFWQVSTSEMPMIPM
jgi:hypothetical protein